MQNQSLNASASFPYICIPKITEIMSIKIAAFDADDTLWVNEPYFQDVEKQFQQVMCKYISAQELSAELLHTETQNIEMYGYGIKSFTLSMVETAIRVSSNAAKASEIKEVVDLGKSLISKNIELLDGVKETLTQLRGKYQLVVATKGDMLDQERKLKRSGLSSFFHHVEIMSEKGDDDYLSIIKKLKVKPDEFVMVGNSLKSDILPVLAIGGYAIHIPYHTTWAHEKVDTKVENPRFCKCNSIKEVGAIIETIR